MKRLLLLLIIPTLSYSQITYEDIMSINSEKTFKRVVIENGFEFGSYDNEYGEFLNYGIDITKDSIDGDRSVLWGRYNKFNGEFGFKFSYGRSLLGLEFNDDDNPYDLIIEKIKKNCKYYDIIEEDELDFVCYSCSQSKYKGKIGFTKSDGSGIIKHIIPKKPITFNDFMSINSVKTFNKVLSKNGYDLLLNNDSILVSFIRHIGYGEILEMITYNNFNGEFGIVFEEDDDERSYTKMIDNIKSNCTFYDTIRSVGYDYVSYNCPQSTSEGKVGYTLNDDFSSIKHIVPKKPITYKDIMSINSVNTYNKVVMKNVYDFGYENDTTIVYGIGLKKDSLGNNNYNEWIEYDKTDDWFRVRFDVDEGNSNDTYNILIDEIKNNCTFYDTLKKDEWTYDYISYDCSESTYKGVIGYVITDSISYITHHPIEKK